MKQTAVEWFQDQIIKIVNGTCELSEIQIFEQAKEMEKEQIIDASKINRVEVIQHSEPYNGRAYTNYNAKDVKIQVQDNNKTLKIFLR